MAAFHLILSVMSMKTGFTNLQLQRASWRRAPAVCPEIHHHIFTEATRAMGYFQSRTVWQGYRADIFLRNLGLLQWPTLVWRLPETLANLHYTAQWSMSFPLNPSSLFHCILIIRASWSDICPSFLSFLFIFLSQAFPVIKTAHITPP